jgi:ribosomal protein S27AE
MTDRRAFGGATFLSEDELFEALTKSAFEFLARAIDEFAESAKFSTVHFAIAIELFLKARLMREHWSLLLDKPDQADKAAFFKGDAKTVTPEQTIERLRRIALVTIPQSSRDIFGTIAKHRNKMVHFAHAGETDADGPDGVQKIAEEQCAGWLALKSLLAEWTQFEDYSAEIWRIGAKMEGHRAYLQKAFAAKAEELKAHRNAGGRVIDCPSCRFESVKVEEQVGSIAKADCVVCRFFHGSEIAIDCCGEDCGEPIRFTSYDRAPSECPLCKAGLSKEDIREALDTGEAITKDNYFDHVPINCPHCSGYHTVVEHHDRYVCTECFELDDTYGVCGHCSEGQLGGVPEHSSLVGCQYRSNTPH